MKRMRNAHRREKADLMACTNELQGEIKILFYGALKSQMLDAGEELSIGCCTDIISH